MADAIGTADPATNERQGFPVNPSITIEARIQIDWKGSLSVEDAHRAATLLTELHCLINPIPVIAPNPDLKKLFHHLAVPVDADDPPEDD